MKELLGSAPKTSPTWDRRGEAHPRTARNADMSGLLTGAGGASGASLFVDGRVPHSSTTRSPYRDREPELRTSPRLRSPLKPSFHGFEHSTWPMEDGPRGLLLFSSNVLPVNSQWPTRGARTWKIEQ